MACLAWLCRAAYRAQNALCGLVVPSKALSLPSPRNIGAEGLLAGEGKGFGQACTDSRLVQWVEQERKQ